MQFLLLAPYFSNLTKKVEVFSCTLSAATRWEAEGIAAEFEFGDAGSDAILDFDYVQSPDEWRDFMDEAESGLVAPDSIRAEEASIRHFASRIIPLHEIPALNVLAEAYAGRMQTDAELEYPHDVETPAMAEAVPVEGTINLAA